MSQELNMGGGVVAPFNVQEGSITITTGNSAFGDVKMPVLSSPVNKGQAVQINGDMIVSPLETTDRFIGFVYNTPKWEIEPRTDYTQKQAQTGGMLREAGIQTIFKQIITMTAATGANIAYSNFVKPSKDGLILSDGNVNSGFMALTSKDEKNRVVVGIL